MMKCAPERQRGTVLKILLVAGLVALDSWAEQPVMPPLRPVAIPSSTFVLDNGLTLVVHEDRKAPLVAVHVSYHVGAKDEIAGRSGFSHLFEHLLFQGSENHDLDFIATLQGFGATHVNGVSGRDRTHYHQVVPTGALDAALWLEADRMANLLGALTQEKLDEQRRTVINEVRANRSRPMGERGGQIWGRGYPVGHPYQATHGPLSDLEAATLGEARDWFHKYYTPSNAVLVLAGDIDDVEARTKVERYFGAIPPGEPLTRVEEWPAPRSSRRRVRMEERVDYRRLYLMWNAPAFGAREAGLLRLFGEILDPRLAARLLDVEARSTVYVQDNEVGQYFGVSVTFPSDLGFGVVEEMVREEIDRLVGDSFAPRELGSAKARLHREVVDLSESVFGKGLLLARSQTFLGEAARHVDLQRWVLEAQEDEVRAAGRGWLGEGIFVLEIEPFKGLGRMDAVASVNQLPSLDESVASSPPTPQTAFLSNGLELVLVERRGVPKVHLRLLVPVGKASDPRGLQGLCDLAWALMSEGTAERSADLLASDLAVLGTRVRPRCGLDVSGLELSAMSDGLRASVEILAEMLERPGFEKAKLERRKIAFASERTVRASSAEAAAAAVLPELLLGRVDPYAVPLGGRLPHLRWMSNATESSLGRIEVEDLSDFHRRSVLPSAAKMVVVGDLDLEAAKALLEHHLGSWGVSGERSWDRALEPETEPESKAAPGIYLLDFPGLQQTVVVAGQALNFADERERTAFEVANGVLGGGYNSRLNQVLREEKGWSYGVRSSILDVGDRALFLVVAAVDPAKTGESMTEIRRQLSLLDGRRPIRSEELSWVRRSERLAAAGRWERLSDVSDFLAESIERAQPVDAYARREALIQELSAGDLDTVVAKLLPSDEFVWVVAGDVDSLTRQLEGWKMEVLR